MSVCCDFGRRFNDWDGEVRVSIWDFGYVVCFYDWLGHCCARSVFTNQIYGAHVTTISELLGRRYNQETRLISALVAAIYTLMVSVTQVIGMGTIIHAVLGWSMTVSMLVGGGIVLFYTILGGMWSVTMTDIIQFIVMTVGIFFVMLPMSLSHVGGWTSLLERLPASHFDLTSMGWANIFQYFLLYTLGMVVSQDIWQRVFTARTPNIARGGAIYAGLYSVAYAVALSVIGMCGVDCFSEYERSAKRICQHVIRDFATRLVRAHFGQRMFCSHVNGLRNIACLVYSVIA